MEIVGAAFWIFVASVVVAGIWYAIARNRETQKTIRLAMSGDDDAFEELVRRRQGSIRRLLTSGLLIKSPIHYPPFITACQGAALPTKLRYCIWV